jgi:hypothetical protein
MTEKIIFLDIDGVLNHLDWMGDFPPSLDRNNESFWKNHLCPDNIKHLKSLVDKTGADVVISSSWRRAVPGEEPYKKIKEWLKDMGCDINIIGQTPQRLSYSERYVEISWWLSENKDKPIDYVILDDISDFGPLQHRLVNTDPLTGLVEEDVEKAIQILEGKMNEKQ